MKILKFTNTSEPITAPITKFGGQPTWIAEPQWPLSRSTSKPMRFICQIALPKSITTTEQQMAYIFMTELAVDDTDFVDGTWEPDGGENAVILQPHAFEPTCETSSNQTGPTIQIQMNGPQNFLDRILKKSKTWWADVELMVNETEIDEDECFHSTLLQEPVWLQYDETPSDGLWSCIAQIDSGESEFYVNFGDGGIGYAFVRNDGLAANFLWQC